MLDILRDELNSLCGGKRPLVLIIFLLPLGFTIGFGVLYSENVVNNIPMIIFDESQTKLSRQLIQLYEDSDRFNVVAYATSQEEVDAAINNGTALAALEIPKDFSKNIRLQNGSTVLFIVNSANNMFGNSSVSTVKEIQRGFNVNLAQKMIASQLLPADAINAVNPVQLGIRILGNPTNGYSPFMLTGLMLNGLQISIMLTLAPALVEELSLRRFPSTPAIIISVGKIIPHILFGVVSFTISLTIATRFFDIPMRGSWFEAIILSGAFLFFVAGALLFFSACSPFPAASLKLPLLYIMPGLLYSGIAYPTFDMSDTAYTFSRLLPISYTAENLRDLLLTGYVPTLWQDIQFMLTGGTIFITVATIIFSLRRRIKKNVEHIQA